MSLLSGIIDEGIVLNGIQKFPNTPEFPQKPLHISLHGLRLYIFCDSIRDTWILPNHTTPKFFLWWLGLEFFLDSLPISSVVGCLVKSAKFSVTEGNLNRLTLCHQYNELISQRSGSRTVTDPEPPSHSMW